MQQMTLCGYCQAMMREAGYKVTETRGRGKITCENCGHRAYGSECDVKKAKVKK